MVLLTQAARELGITRAVLWRHVQAHHLHAERLGHLYVIPRAELERFKRERRKPGRPRARPPGPPA